MEPDFFRQLKQEEHKHGSKPVISYQSFYLLLRGNIAAGFAVDAGGLWPGPGKNQGYFTHERQP